MCVCHFNEKPYGGIYPHIIHQLSLDLSVGVRTSARPPGRYYIQARVLSVVSVPHGLPKSSVVFFCHPKDAISRRVNSRAPLRDTGYSCLNEAIQYNSEVTGTHISDFGYVGHICTSGWS